jgi:hypothetical protein
LFSTDALSVRGFPGGLTAHAAGRIGKRLEAFGCDLSPAILANAVRTLGDPVARVFGLLALEFEDMLDGLAICPFALNLGEVGFPKSFAHQSISIHPGARLKHDAAGAPGGDDQGEN